MSITGFTCSRLTANDAATFKDLLQVFGDAFDDVSTYQDAVPSDQYLRGVLGLDHVIVLVARRDGAVIGGLVAYEMIKFERERKEIYIYDLAVAAPHRRKHVATTLIEALRGIARDRGAYVIFVQADKGDGPAIALYESLGTREDVLHFDIAVDRNVSASSAG